MASFIDNFRSVVENLTFPRQAEAGDYPTFQRTANKLSFENAGEGTTTGRQRITLQKKNGDLEDIYLVVPSQKDSEYGYVTIKDNGGYSNSFRSKPRPIGFADSSPAEELDSGSLDVGGKAEGTIYGLIDANGVTYDAKGAKDFLQNLTNKGYRSIVDYEKPTGEELHRGPGYVPGDILLDFFNLRPVRGATRSSYRAPEDNTPFNEFIDLIRRYGKATGSAYGKD